MLALTRERIVAHLQQVAQLIDVYQRRDPTFVDKTVTWLSELEEMLLQLKNPLASFVAVERGKVLALSDGYRNGDSIASGTSKRRAGYATTVVVLGEVESALLDMLKDIDIKFGSWREKMAQFLAVATAGAPISLPDSGPTQSWLQSVWEELPVSAETGNMYNYLNTVMTLTDRLYILEELISNLLNALPDEILLNRRMTTDNK